MAIVQRIMGSGIQPQAAINIQGSFVGGITAAGTTTADATLLSGGVNYVSTTASSTGVKLPAVAIGDSVTVLNGGAQTLSVYGQSGESIFSGAADAAYSVVTLVGATFYKVTATLWLVVKSA